MASPKPSIYFVGVGPGVSGTLASLFAKAGFDIGLIGRTPSTLSAIQSSLASLSLSLKPKVISALADAANPESLTTALDSVKDQFAHKGPTVVVYNIASNARTGDLGPLEINAVTPDILLKHYTISAVSAFVVGQWAAKNIDVTNASGSKPMLFFTGGGLAMAPVPIVAPFSMAKAALRNLALSFHAELKPKGIHVATVTICGILDDANEKYNRTLVADEYWKLYEQKGVDEWSAETVF